MKRLKMTVIKRIQHTGYIVMLIDDICPFNIPQT